MYGKLHLQFKTDEIIINVYGRWTTYIIPFMYICLTRDIVQSLHIIVLLVFLHVYLIQKFKFHESIFLFDCECNTEKGIIYEEFTTGTIQLKFHVRNKISIVKLSAALTDYFAYMEHTQKIV